LDADVGPAGCIRRPLAGRMMFDPVSLTNNFSTEHKKRRKRLHRITTSPMRRTSEASGNVFLFRLPLFFELFGDRLRHLTVGGKFHGELGLALGQ